MNLVCFPCVVGKTTPEGELIHGTSDEKHRPFQRKRKKKIQLAIVTILTKSVIHSMKSLAYIINVIFNFIFRFFLFNFNYNITA